MQTVLAPEVSVSDPPLLLRFLIIGGGLAGVAAAIALAKRGYTIELLEAQKSFSEIGAGIQLPPNCSKILKHWGLLQSVRLVASSPQEINFRSYQDGALLSQTTLTPDMEIQHGAPHLVVHRGQLLVLLLEEARKHGVQMHTGCQVTNIDFIFHSVETADGRRFTADVLIGADGQQSFCRTALAGNATTPAPVKKMIYRFTVSTELMHGYSDTARLIDPPKVTCWMGPGSHVVCYDLPEKGVCNFVLTRRAIDSDRMQIGPRTAPLDELRTYFDGWDPVLRQALELADTAAYWPLQIGPEPETWTHEIANFILIGDAAHSMTPHLVQGATQCIEDAAFLGELFSKVRTTAHVSDALRILEEVRKERVAAISKKSETLGRLWDFEDGPLQSERDRQLKEMQPFRGYPNPYSDPYLMKMLYDYDVFGEARTAWERYIKGEWAGLVGFDSMNTGAKNEAEVRGVKRSFDQVSERETEGERVKHSRSHLTDIECL